MVRDTLSECQSCRVVNRAEEPQSQTFYTHRAALQEWGNEWGEEVGQVLGE